MSDSFNRNLWAPWRMQYLLSLKQEMEDARAGSSATGRDDDGPHDAEGQAPGAKAPSSPSSSSFLLDYWRQPELDAEHFVIERNQHGIILLNLYPYANGHLLTALGEARPTLTDYDPDQRAHFWRLVDRATELVEKTLLPQGVNIGINQGRAAGAGVPTHLHAHVVPRWIGDTNFISVVGELRIIPEALPSMYRRYRTTVETCPWTAV